MSNMKKIFYALVTPAIFFAFSGWCLAQEQQDTEKCEVAGIVTDLRNDLVIM